MPGYKTYQDAWRVYQERLKVFGPFHRATVQAKNDCRKFIDHDTEAYNVRDR